MSFFNLFKNEKKKDIDYKKIYELLAIFTEVSLHMPLRINKDLLQDKNKYLVVFGYFFGAMDYISQNRNLDDINTIAIFTTYLSTTFTNNNYKSATELCILVMDLSQTVDGGRYMDAGGNTFKRWVKGESMAPIELHKLLKDKGV